jgi:hypothetical protein
MGWSESEGIASFSKPTEAPFGLQESLLFLVTGEVTEPLHEILREGPPEGASAHWLEVPLRRR